ncbi:hypothetical protein [Chakrabartyella piscis]|uniref:hypothetical protein n=1 Tax=Chakrabartyella piscis TaxID=2918914 RepID=UPI0029587888|nr:hypothetical protein [Chakrabartyella piscis]
MSRKNHKMVDGRLLQTDKKFSALKAKQKEKITNWLLTEYLSIVEQKQRLLKKSEKEMIVDNVYEKIQEAEIWIPYYEVRNYFSSKLNKWNNKYVPKKPNQING